MCSVLDLQTKEPALELLHPLKTPDTSQMLSPVLGVGEGKKTIRSQEPPSLVVSVSTRFTERYCLKFKVELGMVTDTFSLST